MIRYFEVALASVVVLFAIFNPPNAIAQVAYVLAGIYLCLTILHYLVGPTYEPHTRPQPKPYDLRALGFAPPRFDYDALPACCIREPSSEGLVWIPVSYAPLDLSEWRKAVLASRGGYAGYKQDIAIDRAILRGCWPGADHTEIRLGVHYALFSVDRVEVA